MAAAGFRLQTKFSGGEEGPGSLEGGAAAEAGPRSAANAVKPDYYHRVFKKGLQYQH